MSITVALSGGSLAYIEAARYPSGTMKVCRPRCSTVWVCSSHPVIDICRLQFLS